MPYGTVNADTLVTSTSGGILGAGNASIMKNRLINGNMVISQRNGTSSVTPDNSYTLDRWLIENTQTGKLTVQQNAGSVTPPVGFTNYLGITSTSAYSLAAGDYFAVEQRIEGFNTADLQWGTANAKTVTLSFWVRSSLTGTFGGSIVNSSYNRSYPFSYTISSANTWEYETITIAGDTTGTWTGATNGASLAVYITVGAGSTFSGTAGAWVASSILAPTGATSVVGTNGATFYITGVQLEVGSSATGFEYKNYGTELNMCQRYYQRVGGGTAQGGQSSTIIYWGCVLPVTMRTNPSLGQTGAQYFYKPGVDVWNQSSTGLTGSSSSPQGAYAGFTNISGVTTQAPYQWAVNYSGTPTYLTCDAEL